MLTKDSHRSIKKVSSHEWFHKCFITENEKKKREEKREWNYTDYQMKIALLTLLIWQVPNFYKNFVQRYKKIKFFTKTILNIMSNFIRNGIVTPDDRDPPWINDKIKSLIKNKTEYFKNCVKPNNPESIRHFEQMQDTIRMQEISKQQYYFKLSRKLSVNKNRPKCYWSILKSFLNSKRIPCILPLIHNNQFVVDFTEKSGLLDSFFAKECTHIETGTNLPTHILRRTNESLNTINFT